MSTKINVSALAQNIADQCKQFEESQEYKDMIQAAVKKLYVSALDDVFRWGEFPNKVKAALKDAMPANIGDFVDLAKYNTLMAKTLQDTWSENAISNNASKSIRDVVLGQIKSLEVPKFVLLSELLEAYVDCTKDIAFENQWGRPNILYQESDTDGYWYLGIDQVEERTSFSRSKERHFQFEQSFAFSPAGGRGEKILENGFPCFEMFSGKLNRGVLGKEAIQFYSYFDKLVAALYYGNAYLVFDDVDFSDIHYPNCD